MCNTRRRYGREKRQKKVWRNKNTRRGARFAAVYDGARVESPNQSDFQECTSRVCVRRAVSSYNAFPRQVLIEFLRGTLHGVLEVIFVPLVFRIHHVRELLGTLLGLGASLPSRGHTKAHTHTHTQTCTFGSHPSNVSCVRFWLFSDGETQSVLAQIIRGGWTGGLHEDARDFFFESFFDCLFPLRLTPPPPPSRRQRQTQTHPPCQRSPFWGSRRPRRYTPRSLRKCAKEKSWNRTGGRRRARACGPQSRARDALCFKCLGKK